MSHNDLLRGSIVTNMFRCCNLLERFARRLASEAGLTSVHQWFILAALSSGEALSLKQLGRNTLVTKQNMTGMIERLKQAGYVATCEAEDDRRITLVKMTEEGKRIFARIDCLGAKCNETTFATFTQEEIAAFHDYLERIVASLQEADGD